MLPALLALFDALQTLRAHAVRIDTSLWLVMMPVLVQILCCNKAIVGVQHALKRSILTAHHMSEVAAHFGA